MVRIKKSESLKVWALFGVSFLLSLGIYLRTLAPTVYSLDSAELTVAAYTLGLTRATGYPLYLLLGKLFTFIPCGDVGYRMNFMSAFFAALTVALLCRFLLRMKVTPPISLAASLTLAFSRYLWGAAVFAEVYTLHAFFVVLLLSLLQEWAYTWDKKWLYYFALAWGLSFGNHMSTILLAPGLLCFLAITGGRRVLCIRTVLPMLMLFTLGLSVYIYLPLRYLSDPPFNQVGYYTASGEFVRLDLTQPSVLFWLVSGRAFHPLMFAYSSQDFIREAWRYGTWLWSNFLVVGFFLGLLGIGVLWKKARLWLIAQMLLFLAHAIFFIGYRVVDKENMFLPTHIIWAIWLGVGADAFFKWIVESSFDSHLAYQRYAAILALVPFLLLPLLALSFNFRYVDLSNDWSSRTHGEYILESVQPNAVVIGWWESVPVLKYLQLVEGKRPDVQVIYRFSIDQGELIKFIDQAILTRPVYTVMEDPTLAVYYNLLPSGAVYRLEKRTFIGSGAK
jgi:hypothetical protein